MLRSILGDNALLLPCKERTKKPDLRTWKELTIDAMRDDRHLQRLIKAKNLGVALGITSAGLVSVDVDDDHQAAAFLDLNPAFASTFMTKGRRGCNFWLQMLGVYPKTLKLKLHGQPWGEFRSHGAQTIVYGIHPAGMTYQWLTRHPALHWTFESIVWPEGIDGLPSKNEHCTDGNDGTQGTDGNEVVTVCVVGAQVSSSQPIDREYVLSVATPPKKHQTHGYLFKLAQGAKALERVEGVFSGEKLRTLFDEWHRRCAPEVLSHDPETYFMEFLSCYKDVRHPLGTGNALSEAFDRARSNPPPPESDLVKDPAQKLLVALCYQLQKIAGKEPFFLSTRDCEKLLGRPWRTMAFWLNGFAVLGILKIVEPGSFKRRRSTRFLYIHRQNDL